jgi:hypothetical protein
MISTANDDKMDIYADPDEYTHPQQITGMSAGAPSNQPSSVSRILKKIETFDQNDDGLADFKPPPMPKSSQKIPRPFGVESMRGLEDHGRERGDGGGDDGDGDDGQIPIYVPSPPVSKIAAANSLGAYTNYTRGYEAPRGLEFITPSTKPAPTPGNLMEKVNYIIHMLEEQQHEKTNNVTEELILYTFLGVFVIFVCDTFARTGRR